MIYKIPYKKLRQNAKAPARAHSDDAGWDLSVSTIRVSDDGKFITYGCGLAFDFSSVGYADARARSSCWKHGVVLSNGAGVIDAGYRGEVMAVFVQVSMDAPIYQYGERFMQLLFPKLGIGDDVEFCEVQELGSSERGPGGYGSSGDN